MSRQTKNRGAVLIAAAAFMCASAQAVPLLTLMPITGAISGAPGDTIGWGFTISNNTDYLTVTSAQFCLDPVSTPACTPPTIGTFTDFISQFNFVVVGPAPESPTVSQSFDASTHSGIGSFAIDGGAAVGATNIGEIVLTYDLFSRSPNDPNFNPDTDTLQTNQFLTANASVLVLAPEPATWLLLGSALAGLGVARVRRRKRS